ncbi:UNVERIFIED_CONTAM: hypothetical protein K2H54_053081 [Gekko kuhli]
MTTEAPPLPAPAAEEGHRGTLLEGQESSEAFRLENGDTAKKVALTASPDDSWGPPLDGPLISFDEDTVVGQSAKKDVPSKESSLSLLTSSETFKMADNCQGRNGGHFVLQGKIPDPSMEQLKAADTSSPSDGGESGSHSVWQGKMPEPFSELPNPVKNSEWTPEGEEERPHKHQDSHPAATADSLKRLEPSDASSEPGQGEEESPHGHDENTSDVRSEQQPSEPSISSQLGVGEESWEADRHGKTPGVTSEFPAQPEAAGGPRETACSPENRQDCLLLQSPNLLQEESYPIFPSHDPIGASSAEPQGTFDTAGVDEGLKPRGQEITETGEGERATGGQIVLGKDLMDPKGQFLEETPVGNSQGRETPAAQDGDHKTGGTFEALASTDLQSSLGIGSQQRAAGTGCDSTFPEAVPPLSPVATTVDSLRPAHGGLAPGRDEEEREGPSGPESRATAGSENKPLGEAGAETVLESEKGEEAAGDVGPGSTTTTREPAGAQVLAREVPSLENGIDPAEAMVLACAPGSLDPRYKEDPQDLSGIQAKPRGGLLFDSKEPTNTEDRVSTAPDSDDLSGAGGWMEDDAGNPENRRPAAETPIEREIRLHLEREELLRRQRGLAGSRGAPEYVEVRIRPFLSQSVPPSPLAKEKELQWAGVQMQREIRRECQREEDLVQLGKVRGAYDRGTPQELQEKKMIFEQAGPETPAPAKTAPGSLERTREWSYAETDGAAGPVAPALPQALPERPSTANPFFSLRAKSPQSLLEREVQEAQERERELQRQRKKIYGSAAPQQPEDASGQDAEAPFQPERPPCKKLDVTWPPPSPSEPCQVNGLHQPERSPRSRQRSALIQRWESGTVGNQESQD